MEKISTKLVIIMLLCFGFWIAQAFVAALTAERARYAVQTQREIADNYVGEQTLMTPFIRIPVLKQCPFLTAGEEEGRTTPACTERVVRSVLILPEHSVWQPEITVSNQRFKRGIYAAKSFETSGTISGKIPTDQIALAANERLDWSHAVWQLALSDDRGMDEMPQITTHGQKSNFTLPQHDNTADHTIRMFSAPWQMTDKPVTEFVIHLRFAGTESLRLLPLGAQNSIEAHSNWPYPSFFGNALPLHKNISAKGFDAQWQNRMAGRHNGELLQNCLNGHGTEDCLSWDNKNWQGMGVRFVDVSDTYSLTERSIKYGMLLITC